jgi:hypothetical protein
VSAERGVFFIKKKKRNVSIYRWQKGCCGDTNGPIFRQYKVGIVAILSGAKRGDGRRHLDSTRPTVE